MKTKNIESFLKHIFQDEYEKGLDYLDLLYFEKWQRLPVILFPQGENGSGKSTFIRFLQIMHLDGFVALNAYEIFEPYNINWAKKRVIAFDGINANLEFTEKIKCLQTCQEVMVIHKMNDAYSAKFCGCFVIIGSIGSDITERRSWTLNPQKVNEPDWELLYKMSHEMRDFIKFLRVRHRFTSRQGRLYFQ